MKHLVAPSILSADFGNLQRDIEMLNESAADWIHFDVMDGVFVPNISFGLPVLKAIKQHARKPLDVHLMMSQPSQFIEDFAKAGAYNLTIHMETCPHLHKDIQQIHASNMKAGVCLNPHTPVNTLEEIIQDVDLVLIMTVNPGFGGQKFIPHSYEKIRKLKKLIEDTGSNALIEVDGGISTENAPRLVESGVDVLVAGSFVFRSDDPRSTIKKLKVFG
ncbi:MAG: ribulose-phosphate 3-epimerase [Bacteroidales bacterium]